ncbi:MAG TPA: uroporphyrinogen decarboxylase family protein [Candidatus Hydrogenedentes bacterium]|nr:uroporphyrinogen decarboxylase family protein [Candidatus Hydrogenedentota bacterium]
MKAQAKISRVMAAIEHREADRVPIGEFFWTNFLRRAKAELPVGDDFDPYRYWDLDLIVINPNMDPHITGIEVLENTPDRKVVKTGFGATIERRHTYPMPHYADFDTKTFDQMDAFRFDDPKDERRFFAAVDDQINSVGDELNLNLPSFIDRVNAYADDFCVFGSVCEPHEMIWRIMGTENVLLKLGEDPARVARFIERLGDFLVGIVEGQVAAAKGRLSGLYVWGDIAYDRGMFFSPAYWREVYKPQVRRICDAIHAAGLKAVYHGCGNASAVFEDMIEAGIDAYNPLEAKAGLNVVALERHFGKRWAFNGNIDVVVLATNDREKVRREVLTKLNAAKGGGYIPQSDHSVPDNVAPATYDYVVQLVREYGKYPLDLGEFDLDLGEIGR